MASLLLTITGVEIKYLSKLFVDNNNNNYDNNKCNNNNDNK